MRLYKESLMIFNQILPKKVKILLLLKMDLS